MVAHLLRLKLTLLRNSVRRSPWQLVGLGIGALYALGLVGLAVSGLVFLRGADAGLAQTVVVLGGAAALLGWAIVPVAASAADMTLDPARFTTLAVPMPRLLAGLALGGLIGIPGIATSLVALATVATWSRSVRRRGRRPLGRGPRRPELRPALQGGHHGHGRAGQLPPVQGRQLGGLPDPVGPAGPHHGRNRRGDRRLRGFPGRACRGVVLDPGRCGLVPGRRTGGRRLRRRCPQAGHRPCHPRRPCAVLEGPAAACPGHPAIRRRHQEARRGTGPLRAVPGDADRRGDRPLP